MTRDDVREEKKAITIIHPRREGVVEISSENQGTSPGPSTSVVVPPDGQRPPPHHGRTSLVGRGVVRPAQPSPAQSSPARPAQSSSV